MKKYILITLIGSLACSLFAANNEIFISSSSNFIENSKQITFVGARSGEGYFSTDGKKMIYQSEREEGNPFYQMFILDLESGKSTRVSTGKGMTTCGWIHPNQKKVMWSSTHLDKKFEEKVKQEYSERAQPIKKRYSWSYDDQYDIFESDLTGKNIKRLTKELGYDAEGSYSPNGKLIAFASNRSMNSDTFSDDEKKILEKDASYTMEIYIMNSDGSNVKRLTNTHGYDGGPFFSADGKKITWRRFSSDGNRAEIYTMNIDGSEQKQITELNSLSWAPFYHPSGEYIIFASSVLGYQNFELFIVDANGDGKPLQVSFSEGFDGLASFSPDGNKITWTHRNEKGESQIYLADWNHKKALEEIQKQRSKVNSYLSSLTPDINENDAKQVIKFLASDEFKGRTSGSREEKVYTNIIQEKFKNWGLEPAIGNNFVQEFEFTSSVKAEDSFNTLGFKGRYESELTRGVDFQVISYSKSGEFNAAPVVFAGYGIKAPAIDKLAEFDSYKSLDVKGKWVLVLDHIPLEASAELKQHLLSYSRPQHKITVAKNNDALGVIFVSNQGIKELKFEGSLSESTLPVVKITTNVLSEMLKKGDAKFKSYENLEKDFSSMKEQSGFLLSSQYVAAKIKLEHIKSIGRNVIGVLHPSVRSNKKAILLGAHGDHLGLGENIGSSLARADEKSQIHYGADDNASGVAGVLELAHYFSQEKTRAKLRKPLYFAVWSGEEIGVLGSNHFAKSWKIHKKSNFSTSFEAALNMDMIGRYRDKLYIQGVGSAKEWPGLSEEVALVAGMPFSITKDPYLPTDSMSFYLAEVPSISFFTGTHEEYHSPRDREALINYPGLVKTINVVKIFTEKLATVGAQQVKYEKVEGNSGQKLEGRSFRIYLGTIPDYSQEGVKGVKISGASKSSPAEKAGLLAGDVITSFNKTPIENLYDYVYALQSAKPNEVVKISVLRNGKKIELDITPVLKE